MPPLRDRPIRQKLVVIGVSASVLALTVASLVFLLSTYLSLRANLLRELRAQAAIIAANTSAAVAFVDEGDATETVGALRSTPRVDIACVYDGTGDLFAVYVAA